MSWPGPGWAPCPGLVLLCVLSSVDGQVCEATRSSVLTEHEVQVQGFDGAESEILPLLNVNTVSGKTCSGFSQFSAAPAFLAICVPDKHACNYRVVSRALKILHPLSQKISAYVHVDVYVPCPQSNSQLRPCSQLSTLCP